jgi:ABC-type dipeptide/oligopeptide/nickel transport system ATPase component
VARALSLDPEFLVLDEPVSNLDVSIQAQIINLLLDLKERLSLTYLFISHDLNLVAYLSDRIGVMYRGRLVELAATEEILGNPLHPYTRRLFAAAPGLGGPGPGQRPPGGRGPGERGPEGRGPAGPGPVGQGLGHPVVQLPVERPPGTESSAQRPQARGCRFGEQCTRAVPACRENDPELLDAGGGHLVACLRAEGAPGGAGKNEATRRQGTA